MLRRRRSGIKNGRYVEITFAVVLNTTNKITVKANMVFS
jgi:hypothetical protein